MLLNLYMYMLIFMFFSGIFVFCSMRKHLLLTLISLEYLMVVIFLMFVMYLYMFMYEKYFLLLFLTFSVCEGAVGLSILVMLIRLHGNDNIQVLSSLLW